MTKKASSQIQMTSTKQKKTSESEVTISLTPCPASRPKVGRWGVFYGKTYAAWKSEADTLLRAIDFDLVEGPLAVEVEQVCKKPKTTKRDYPRGDVDNHAKGPLDAITRSHSGWHDDDQIVELTVTKRFAEGDETPCSKIRWRPVAL